MSGNSCLKQICAIMRHDSRIVHHCGMCRLYNIFFMLCALCLALVLPGKQNEIQDSRCMFQG